MTSSTETDWYSTDTEKIFSALQSSEAGLSEDEVRKRLQSFGYNIIKTKPSDTIPRIIFRQLHDPIVYVLLCAAALAAMLGKINDSYVMLFVVLINGFIGFIQEYKAHRSIRALSSMIPHKTSVIRGGEIKLIHSSHLVPGDVVVLEAGDRIAVDLRIFSAKNLSCDESTLTGESVPVIKKVDTLPQGTVLAERRNMVFNGCYVASGVGRGIVVATGVKTEFGKISKLVEQVEVLQTPMSITVRKIAKSITLGVLLVSFILFLIGFMRGNSLFDAGLAAITLAVAALPEGLPAIITIASSIGVLRMAKKQTLIRQLPAVEALGSTSIICTDKTGTLTYNEMTVQQLWTPSGFSFVSGGGYSLEGHFEFPNIPGINQEVEELLTAAILCSDATLDQTADGVTPIGDPTEIALIVAGRKKGMSEDKIRCSWKRKDLIPFASEKRMMSTLTLSPNSQNCIFIKGAPEEVVKICNRTSDLDKLPAQAHSMAKEGLRVLAVAKKEINQNIDELKELDVIDGFTFLGFIGMIDPPRKEVYQALKSCHEAGINVKMVTGDHPLTAEAVARDLGILGKGKVLSGQEIASLTSDEWKKAITATQVFARVAPEDKLKLVVALQELGHVVAMTGDGVNDAAALKRADIGIAMGINGTAVARESSDMILADDNFASIELAVEEGRRVYDNLIKSLTFVIPTSLGLAFIILLAILFFPVEEQSVLYPMSPIQILWINLVVAVGLSLALGFESSEPNIMKRPPRKKEESVFSKYLAVKTIAISLVMALGTIGVFLWEYKREIATGALKIVALAEAQTIAVIAMMLFQIIYLFNCRSLSPLKKISQLFSNPILFIGIGFVILVQIAFVYVPFMNRIFKSHPLDFEAWMISIFAALFMLPVLWLEKLIKKKLDNTSL